MWLYDDFSTDTEVATADTGHVWQKTSAPVEAEPIIVDGKYSTADTAAAVSAGYIETKSPRAITEIGARWTFSEYSSIGAGAAGIITWATPILERVSDHAFVAVGPASACHLAVTPASWAYGVIDGSGNFSPIGSGSFSPTLTANGETEHEAVVTFTGTQGATIALPDGSRPVVSNSLITAASRAWACFEVFATDASTGSKAAFTEVWSENGLPGASRDNQFVSLKRLHI